MDPLKQKYNELIKSLVPISGLAGQYQNEVVHKAEILKFKKKQQIFKQGDVDPYTFYLLDGELELEANGQLLKTVLGGSMDAQSPLSQLQPRQMSAQSKGKTVVLRIPRDLMDRLLTMDHPGGSVSAVEVTEVEVDDDDEGGDWMTRMLQSELFSRIPPANIQRLFTVMESVKFKAGDVVIEQGSPGDYYYIIQSGSCEVTRKASSSGKPIKLAQLADGDSFGEEALISDAKRNATVSMLGPGELVRLTKEDFIELIKKPSLESVDHDAAKALVAEGACWLDVRFPEEHAKDGIEASVNIPLNQLRTEVKNLDSDRIYVAYCDSGARSSAGAFLLAQNGIEVCYLDGGMISQGIVSPGDVAAPPEPEPESVPEEPEVVAEAPEPEPEPKPEPKPKAKAKPEPKPKAKAQPKPEPEPKPAAEAAPVPESAQADVRASELAEDVAKADTKMEQAMRLKAEAEAEKRAAAKKLESRNKELEAKAAKEKADLEDKAVKANAALEEAKRQRVELEKARRAAEAEAEAKRKEEEERLHTIKLENEKRLEAEKAKLEAEYAKQAEELAKLEEAKEKAKAELSEEREALERKASAANRELEKAEKAKQEADEVERRVREQSEAAIRAERDRLEAEFARAAEQLAEAQQEREMAEMVSQEAAKKAAQRIAEEKVAQELARQEDESRLEAERLKLKEEAKELRATLEEAKKAQAKAEARAKAEAKAKAEVEAKAKAQAKAVSAKRKQLKQQEAKVARDMIAAAHKSDPRGPATMSSKDDELVRANAMLAAAEAAHKKAEQAKQDLEDTQSWKKSELDALRQQMEAELAEFKDENPTPTKDDEDHKNRVARMKQFEKRRKAAEKKRDDANSLIADEVASQLK
jgi:CRP-like cAMP-binding protein